jgi:type I restriction enzyme, R subunit
MRRVLDANCFQDPLLEEYLQSSRDNLVVFTDFACMETYRLDLVRDGSIALKAGEEAPVYGPTEAGMKRSESEQVKLSEIIDLLNERFGTDFKKADQLAIDSVAEELKADQAVQQHAAVNPIDNFALAVKAKIEGAFVDRMDKNADIAARFLNDADFRAVLTDYLVRKVHSELAGRDGGSHVP